MRGQSIFLATLTIIVTLSLGEALAGQSDGLSLEAIIHQMAADGYDAHSILCKPGVCMASVGYDGDNLMLVAVNARTGKVLGNASFGRKPHVVDHAEEISGKDAVASVTARGKFTLMSMEYEGGVFVVRAKDEKDLVHKFRVDEGTGAVAEIK